MILTTALCVSKESHSGSAPPQPFNKSKTENHHKANGGLFLDGFIGMLTMSYSQWGVGRAMHPVVPLRKQLTMTSQMDHFFGSGVSPCFFLHGFRSIARRFVRPRTQLI
jgi:hypothetical protein